MNYAKALETYLRRQSRAEHPDGSFDQATRWYPSDGERQECCRYIRGPSRKFPYGYLTHCRSLPNVASLYGVDEIVLRSLARNVTKLDGLEIDRVAQVIVADFRVQDGKISGVRVARLAKQLREEKADAENSSLCAA